MKIIITLIIHPIFSIFVFLLFSRLDIGFLNDSQFCLFLCFCNKFAKLNFWFYDDISNLVQRFVVKVKDCLRDNFHCQEIVK